LRVLGVGDTTQTDNGGERPSKSDTPQGGSFEALKTPPIVKLPSNRKTGFDEKHRFLNVRVKFDTHVLLAACLTESRFLSEKPSKFVECDDFRN
jgi:hypothetical protein